LKNQPDTGFNTDYNVIMIMTIMLGPIKSRMVIVWYWLPWAVIENYG